MLAKAIFQNYLSIISLHILFNRNTSNEMGGKRILYKQIKLLFNHIKKYGVFICICLILTIMVSVMQVWTADKLIPIIENALDGNKSKMIESMIHYLKLILGLIILTYLRNLIAYKLSSKCEKKLYADAIQSLSKKGIAYFDNNDSGNIISILNNDTKKIKGFIRNDLIQIIYIPVLFLIILLYMLNVSKTLTIIVFVLITLTNIFAFVKSSDLDNIALQVKTAEGDLNSLEKEILNDAYSIRITNASKFFNCKHKNLVEKLNEKEILLAKMSAINYIPSLINEYVPLIIVIIFGSLFVAKGKISIGQFTAYIQLMTYLCLPMSKYAKMIVDLRFTMASVTRYNNIFSFKDERADGYSLYINGSNQKDTPIVKFEHVTFSYNNKKNVLSDINFSVNKCEKIGIVGPTGCGKSTILKLIMGFYVNQGGKILFNGSDLSNIKLESLREHISLVGQNKYIFPDTVAYNISSGRYRDYQEDEKGILKAANDAMISDYVLQKMNKGFNSILYQSGSNLSEGQKTRSALARAFYKNAALLILDEPTAALDEESERQIMDTIFSNVNLTAIIVSHRVSTVKKCNRIIVLSSNGTIEEVGSYEQLMRDKGAFCKYYIS